MRLAGKSGQLGPVWLQNVCKKLGCKAQLFCRISSETDRRRNGTRAGGRRTRLTIYGKVNRKKIRWGARAPGPGARLSDVRKAPYMARPGGAKKERPTRQGGALNTRLRTRRTRKRGARRTRPAEPCTAIVAQAAGIVKPQRRKSRSSERKGGAAARLDPCAAATMKGARAGGGTQHRPAPRGGPPERRGPAGPSAEPCAPREPPAGAAGAGGQQGRT